MLLFWNSHIKYLLSKFDFEIISINGASDGFTWVSNNNIKLTDKESNNLVAIFSINNSITNIKLFGKKYYIIDNYNNIIYIRSNNKGGCIIRTNLTIIIGIYKDNKIKYYYNHYNCNKVIEEYSKFLIKHNF